MQEILALTLTSLQHDMARLDHVALNLANVATPGYKRQVLAVQPFAEAMRGAAAQAGATEPAAVVSDLRTGTIKTTGQPLDLALAGDGYFEVLTDSGPAYTRKGDFTVDARGRLVTAQGFPVMGKGGDIRLSGRAPTIDEAGNVSEAATDGSGAAVAVGQLKVVHFDKSQALRRLGDGLLAPGEGMALLADGEVRLRQGALENSNVNATREMVDLMQAMRHFETMHRVVQGYDEMIGGAVRKLGEA
ncbi:MAG TPA: flagellar hook basal-body protein [Ramlibacter sp.]|nr:flagellar hook basal-body protein [Ramlibacter sp.]